MKLLFNLWLLTTPLAVCSQNNAQVYKVSYHQYDNKHKLENDRILLFQHPIVSLSKPSDQIQLFSDIDHRFNISTISHNGKTFALKIPFTDLPQPTFESETDTILNYLCQKAEYSYFSNKIEVWYTRETHAKGSPLSSFLPTNNALVLKVRINDNREIIASEISTVSDFSPVKSIPENIAYVSKAEFEEIKINSRFTRFSVFSNDTVNFIPDLPLPAKEKLETNKVYRLSKGSVILKKIVLDDQFKGNKQVFAKLSCRSNGDAYDRTGSVFIIPDAKPGTSTILNAYLEGINELPVFWDNDSTDYQGICKTENYDPPIELMRFFTSFGAGHFNEKRAINNYDWFEDIVYKQEVSSLIPTDVKEMWVGVFIGNYDSGGHIVSLDLDIHPSFEEETEIHRYLNPLFSTINTLEMSEQEYGKLFNNDTLKVNFEITEEVSNLRLLYTSTGHGGWGNGDEFNPKLNQLFIDGEAIFTIVPWRTDCASYRLLNPASGNFGNGLSSSDLSRSNWCPGTLTPPYIIPLNIAKGKHTIEVIIDQGDAEGNSFSHWSVTGVLTGELLKPEKE